MHVYIAVSPSGGCQFRSASKFHEDDFSHTDKSWKRTRLRSHAQICGSILHFRNVFILRIRTRVITFDAKRTWKMRFDNFQIIARKKSVSNISLCVYLYKYLTFAVQISLYFVDRRVTDHFIALTREKRYAKRLNISFNADSSFTIEKGIWKHCVFAMDKVDARTRDVNTRKTTRRRAGKKRRGSPADSGMRGVGEDAG